MVEDLVLTRIVGTVVNQVVVTPRRVPATVPERLRGVRMATWASSEVIVAVDTGGVIKEIDLTMELLGEAMETVSVTDELRTGIILSVGVRVKTGPSYRNRSATSSSQQASASFVRSLGTCPATVRATREFGRTDETGPRASRQITLNLT